MAIAVNDSRWARATGNNGNDGPTSSQTPAADSVLIAVVQTTDSDGTITVSGGGASLAVAWAQQVVTAAGRTYIWTATVGPSPGAFQILADDGEGGLGGPITIKVYEITGAHPADYIGATATGTSASENITPTVFNSTADNSRTFGGGIDTVGNLIAPTSSDVGDAMVDSGGFGGIAVYKAADTATSGTGVTLNFNGSEVTGGWSWAAIEILPAIEAAPDAPTNLTGQSGQPGFVPLTWTAPSAFPAITDYDVDFALASAPTSWLGEVSTGSTAAAFNKTGLTNGVAYVFRVRAVNSVGDGTWSSTSAEFTPDGAQVKLWNTGRRRI